MGQGSGGVICSGGPTDSRRKSLADCEGYAYTHGIGELLYIGKRSSKLNSP